jgi:hypothetical protein
VARLRFYHEGQVNVKPAGTAMSRLFRNVPKLTR